jgi:hypothetical protein
VRPGVRHRDRRLLAQKRTEANLDAANVRPTVRAALIPQQSRPQPSVPLRGRQEVQETLRQGLKNVTGPPRGSYRTLPLSRRLGGLQRGRWFLCLRELSVKFAVTHRSDQYVDDHGELVE